MDMDEMLKDVFANIPDEDDRFVKKGLDIRVQVKEILAIKGLSQIEFAKLLNKKPSEVSRWLSGLHNLTLESITKMESVLGCDIIVTPKQSCKQYPTYDKFKLAVFGEKGKKEAAHGAAFSIHNCDNLVLAYA